MMPGSARAASENAAPAPYSALECKPQTRKHIEVVDVLRGLSALMIVLFHVRTELWVGWRQLQAMPEAFSWFDHAAALLSAPTPFFGHAVMLFFVISGFCIHLPQAKGTSVDLRAYFPRRIVRIYAPYVAAVLLTWGIQWGIGWVNEANTGKFWQTLLMVQNYVSPGQMAANPSLWSLPVEMELYIAYPLLFWTWRRFGAGNAFILVGTVSILATTAYVLGLSWLNGNFAIYWAIWASGALLAEWWASGSMPRWSFLATVGLIVFGALGAWSVLYGIPVCFQHMLWGAFYFMLFWRALDDRSAEKREPGLVRSFLARVGGLSYSLYLIHFPIFFVLGKCWVEFFGQKPQNFLVCVAATALVIPLSAVFYRLIESPSHRLARKVEAHFLSRPLGRGGVSRLVKGSTP